MDMHPIHQYLPQSAVTQHTTLQRAREQAVQQHLRLVARRRVSEGAFRAHAATAPASDGEAAGAGADKGTEEELPTSGAVWEALAPLADPVRERWRVCVCICVEHMHALRLQGSWFLERRRRFLNRYS